MVHFCQTPPPPARPGGGWGSFYIARDDPRDKDIRAILYGYPAGRGDHAVGGLVLFAGFCQESNSQNNSDLL